MYSSKDYEHELFDTPKRQSAKYRDEIVSSKQKQDNRASIKGRPNIDEISKRNEDNKKQDRRSSYQIQQ